MITTLPDDTVGQSVSISNHSDSVILSINTGQTVENLTFEVACLEFMDCPRADIFSKKNNKTLAETIAHPRYQSLALSARTRYPQALNDGLGQFLAKLKSQGDPFYLRFLNAYGDLTFCSFRLNDPRFLRQKGLYLYATEDKVQYIGRCLDAFGKRINLGYGTIHPKNCYRDGQSTNCHLNALVAQNRSQIRLYICAMDEDAVICRCERQLIQLFQPQWNIQLR